jgi:chromosome partitioning protein
VFGAFWCVQPLVFFVEEIAPNLGLVPGDLLLSGAEQELSFAWASSLDRQLRAFRVTAAFATVAQRAAKQADAEIVLVDVGPNLGAINRAAMVASDHVVVPLRPDLYSLQGLRNLGPTLDDWRQGWSDRIQRAPDRADLELPGGEMRRGGCLRNTGDLSLERPALRYRSRQKTNIASA